MKKILSKKLQGSAYIWTMIIVILVFMLFSVILQYLRGWIIASDVKSKVSSAVIAVSQDNYENIYSCSREGYTGAYKYADNNNMWKISISPGDVYGELNSSLKVINQNGKHVKYAGSDIDYMIYDLDVEAEGSRFQSAGSTNEKFTAVTTVTLEVPMFFCGESVEPMILELKCKSNYDTKF